jgi:hypothetical protein
VFESARLYKERTELTKRLNNWEGFFPKDFRPLMYAWAMRESDDDQVQEQIDQENKDLNEIMRHMERMEQEQHRMLPACIQCCCCPDMEDEEEDDVDWDDRDSVRRMTVAGGAPANAGRLRAVSREQMRTGGTLRERASKRLTQRERASQTGPRAVPGISKELRELPLRQSFGTGTVSGGIEDVRQSVLFRRRQKKEEQEARTLTVQMRLPKLCRQTKAFVEKTTLGTTLRTVTTFLMLMATWGLTVYCVVQYDMESTESARYESFHRIFLKRDDGCLKRERRHLWIVNLVLYYAFWLVIVPITTMLQKYGYLARWKEWLIDRCRRLRRAPTTTFGGME